MPLLRLKPVDNRPVRILDFDCEARPLSWYGGDFTTKEITAIAWQFVGEPKTLNCVALGNDDLDVMLSIFLSHYEEADVVTGHYIRNFDLPLLNAQLAELDMKPLQEKWTQDTKNDLIRWHGASKSQENIAAMLGTKYPKIIMSQADWREANRLTPRGIELTRSRVMGDVLQHMEMRQKLLDLGQLSPGKMWKP
jgi:DNA polymerase elongation subunit (family B)